MATGLNVSDFVRVSVTIQPLAAQYRNFGQALKLGSTPGVIDTVERMRYYASLEGVAADFGTDAPEYKAAALHFGQDPQPLGLFIGRWAQTATKGVLHGAVLSVTQQLLSGFTAITNGSLHILVDGTGYDVTGINLSTALNLNGVASLIQTAIQAVKPGVTVTWDGTQKRFDLTSGTTGPSSSIGYVTAAASGTALGPLLHFTSVDASAPVVGVAAESLAACVAALADQASDWYSLEVATVTPPSDADHIATALLVEGLSQSRIYGVTITNTNVLDPASSADLASQLKALGLRRTYYQFTTSNPFAASSLFGRAATVNFEGSNTTITLAYKSEPGVVPELVTESQFQTLLAKNCNVFVRVNNDTAIVFPGRMASGDYFDERHGADWLQNKIQTDVYNLLYLTPTKIPQTDDGMDTIRAVIKAACAIAVTNGLLAPGVWTGPPIGPVKRGDVLPNGYYVHAPAVATQSDADRAARKSVPFQVLAKFAGAVHLIDIAATLNR